MFSVMTMLASIIIPMLIASPPSESRFAEIPARHISMNATSMQTGTASAATSRRAEVAEQQEQDEDDQDLAGDQRIPDGRDAVVDQDRLVVERHDRDIARQVLPELGELLLTRSITSAVFDPSRRIVIPATTSPLPSSRHRALPHFRADLHGCHVLDVDRHALFGP